MPLDPPVTSVTLFFIEQKGVASTTSAARRFDMRSVVSGVAALGGGCGDCLRADQARAQSSLLRRVRAHAAA